MFLPGIDLATEKDLKELNFPFILFITGCMAIGAVANVLGIGKIVSDLTLPVMQGMNATGIMMLVWVISVVLNLILTPLAIWATLSAPLANIALALGMDPLAFMYIMNYGTDQIFMPYEYALYLIYFSFGLIYFKDFVKLFTVKTILNGIFLVMVMIPYWKLIGLL